MYRRSSSSRSASVWLCGEAQAARRLSTGRVTKYASDSAARSAPPALRPVPGGRAAASGTGAPREGSPRAPLPCGFRSACRSRSHFVGLLHQHHPHGRPPVRCRGRERHCLGRGEACVAASANQCSNCFSGSGSKSRVSMGARVFIRSARPIGELVRIRATTKTIDIRTAIPGPALGGDSRAQGARHRGREVDLDPDRGAGGPWRHAHRRRRQHLHRLHRRRRLPERRPRAPAGPRGRAASRSASFIHTDFTVVPVRAYVELAERLSRSAPIRGPAKAAFFNAGTEAVENAVKFARALHEAAGRDRLRGRLPRPDAAVDDADLEDAPVQGRPRARSRPRSTASPFPQDYRGPERRDGARRRSSGRSSRRSPPSTSPRSSIEPVQGEGGFVVAPQEFLAGLRAHLRRARHRPGRRRGADRLRPHGQDVRDRALRRRARPDHGREVDRRRPPALRRHRQRGDHGRRPATRRSAAPTSATRSRRPPRSPCWTSSRRRGSSSARRRSARRSARGWTPGRSGFAAIGDVRGLGAMLAIELVEDRRRRSRRRSSRSARGRGRRRTGPAPAEVGHLLELHPRPRRRS